MRPIREGGGIGLIWNQLDFQGNHQLLMGQDVAGTLSVFAGKRGPIGVAVTADGEWAFGDRGLFRRYIAIQSGGVDLGRYVQSSDKLSGNLRIPTVPAYSWSREEAPTLHWSFHDPLPLEVVHFTGHSLQERPSGILTARVDLDPLALDRPETPLLVMLCGYLVARGDDKPVVTRARPDGDMKLYRELMEGRTTSPPL